MYEGQCAGQWETEGYVMDNENETEAMSSGWADNFNALTSMIW